MALNSSSFGGWMEGWMDVLHSRRHRRCLLFWAIAVSFSPIAVVFFSASAGLLCGKNGVLLVHLKVRELQLSVTLEKRFRTEFSAEKMVQKWRSNARAPLLFSVMLDVRNSCGVGVERILLPTSKRKKGIGGEEERRGMSENHTDTDTDTQKEKRRKRERVSECCGNGGGCTLSWCLLSSSLSLCAAPVARSLARCVYG